MMTFDFWKPFISSLMELNEWIGNRAIRRYQLATYLRRPMQLTCPVSGATLADYELFMDQKLTIFIKFSASYGDIVIFSKDYGKGFPLDGFLLLSDSGCTEFFIEAKPGKPFEAIAKKSTTTDFGSLFLTNPLIKEVDDLAIIAFNSPNFAHVYWNLLPALYTLSFLGMIRHDTTLVTHFNPLGNVSEIVPNTTEIVTLSPAQLFTNGAAIIKIKQGANLGATYVPSSLTRQVLSALHKQIAPATQATLQTVEHNPPVFWVSVQKLFRRQLLNQEDFITRVLIAFFTTYPKGTAILDGFSPPLDGLSILQNQWTRFIQDVDKDIQNITAKLKAALPDIDLDKQLININGLPISEALLIAASADYYLCHSGTQQHKISWFYDTPGIIHSPVPHPPGAIKWYGEQVETATIPKHIPDKWIEASDDNADDLKNRNKNYQIKQPIGVANWVIQQMQDYLHTAKGR